MNTNEVSVDSRKTISMRSAIVVLAGLAVLAVLFAALSGGRSDEKDSDEPLWTVARGPLTISVTEAGRIQNKDEIIVRNETDCSLKILSLTEEGTVVKKGDIIISLDDVDLESARDSAALDVRRLESDLMAATERREILKSQMQSNVEKAELDLKFARLDLERVTLGVHPQSLEAADANITMAEEDLERAEEDYAWSTKLSGKGFITLKELKADELSAKQKRLNLKIKKSDHALLIKYTHPQEVEKLGSAVKQSEMALDRNRRLAKAELTGQQAEMFKYEDKLLSARKELTKLEERLVACKIVAPADGMVIFATSGGRRRHQSRERMEVGATVLPKHPLVRMPTSSKMQAVISVQEASKPKLSENMVATVTVDALPDRTFLGKLTEIAILPDSTQSWLNPDLKVYNCKVELDASDEAMRPGMNCEVEIVIEEHSDAWFVPIQCVLQIDGQPTVYLQKKDGVEKRVVSTGRDNNVMIHILDGLSDGDEVMLAPPLEEAMKHDNGSSHASPDVEGVAEPAAE